MKVRTRFAPSPTGYLHLGGARTALFAWAYARHFEGDFILRIEDTDQERSTKEASEAILESLAWLGLNYDEGPFYQSDRFSRYAEIANDLLQSSHAYVCDCSSDRLSVLREGQIQNGEKPRYDGHCREKNLAKQEGGKVVVRFKTPKTGLASWVDGVRGEIIFENNELDDFVMIRSDGVPTYNFCVVVDDVDMNISHVIRGEDHVNNTPRQIHVYQALGKPVPHFSHVPSILGSDGKKLSKRHGALSVMEYRNAGFMPEALLNYLVRLGWSFKDEEIFSRTDIIQKFSMESVNRSPAAFNMDKLIWLNQHYLKTLPIERVIEEFQWHLQASGLKVSEGPDLKSVMAITRERVKTLQELVQQIQYFYKPITSYEPAALEKVLKDGKDSVKNILLKVQEKLKTCDWEASGIHRVLTELAAELNLGMGKIGMPLRLALTGGLQSPSIDATTAVLGRPLSLQRITDFLK